MNSGASVSDTLAREPAAIGSAVAGLISAGIKMVTILELVHWTAAQAMGVQLFADAALAVALLFFIRSRVTPVAAPQLPVGTVIEVTSSEPAVIVVPPGDDEPATPVMQ